MFKQNLVTIILTISTLAGVVGMVGCILRGQTYYIESTNQRLSALTEMIATNCQAALAFSDKTDAQRVLNSLKAEPSVSFAGIYSKTGELLASYYRTPPKYVNRSSPTPADNSGLTNCRLFSPKIVTLQNEIIGTVKICGDVDPMCVMLKQNTSTILVLLVFTSWGLTLFIYSSLQKNFKRLVNTLNNQNSSKTDIEARLQQ